MMDRRRFFRIIAGALGAIFLFPKHRAGAKTLSLNLDMVEALKTVGESKTLKIKGRLVLLIRDSETAVYALDPTCTHKKCTVAYNSKSRRIECPCHKSAYDLEGNVLNGPAKLPLTQYGARLESDRILLELPGDE